MPKFGRENLGTPTGGVHLNAAERKARVVFKDLLQGISQAAIAERLGCSRSTVQHHRARLVSQQILVRIKKGNRIVYRRGPLAHAFEAGKGVPKIARTVRGALRGHRGGRFVQALHPEGIIAPDRAKRNDRLNGSTVSWTWKEKMGGKSYGVQLTAGMNQATLCLFPPVEFVTGESEVAGLKDQLRRLLGALADRMASEHGWKTLGPGTLKCERGPEFGVQVKGYESTPRMEGVDGAGWYDGSGGGEFETDSQDIAESMTRLPTEQAYQNHRLKEHDSQIADLKGRVAAVIQENSEGRELLELMVKALEEGALTNRVRLQYETALLDAGLLSGTPRGAPPSAAEAAGKPEGYQ